MDRFWEETLRNPRRTPDGQRNAVGYFLGVLERTDTAPDRRRRAQDAIKGFRVAAGTA